MSRKNSDQIEISAPVPVLRIFDLPMALAFYQTYLGMAVDWIYRANDYAPAYVQVSRSALRLHLSEHFGDACPGARLFIPLQAVEELHEELTHKTYKFANPSLDRQEWGTELQLSDPFGNRLTFCRQESH